MAQDISSVAAWKEKKDFLDNFKNELVDIAASAIRKRAKECLKKNNDCKLQDFSFKGAFEDVAGEAFELARKILLGQKPNKAISIEKFKEISNIASDKSAAEVIHYLIDEMIDETTLESDTISSSEDINLSFVENIKEIRYHINVPTVISIDKWREEIELIWCNCLNTTTKIYILCNLSCPVGSSILLDLLNKKINVKIHVGIYGDYDDSTLQRLQEHENNMFTLDGEKDNMELIIWKVSDHSGFQFFYTNTLTFVIEDHFQKKYLTIYEENQVKSYIDDFNTEIRSYKATNLLCESDIKIFRRLKFLDAWIFDWTIIQHSVYAYENGILEWLIDYLSRHDVNNLNDLENMNISQPMAQKLMDMCRLTNESLDVVLLDWILTRLVNDLSKDERRQLECNNETITVEELEIKVIRELNSNVFPTTGYGDQQLENHLRKLKYLDSEQHYYYGTIAQYAFNILRNGLDVNESRPCTDFGQGLYVGTDLRKAIGMANRKSAGDTDCNSWPVIIVYRCEDRSEIRDNELNLPDNNVDWQNVVKYYRKIIRRNRNNRTYYDKIDAKYIISGLVLKNWLDVKRDRNIVLQPYDNYIQVCIKNARVYDDYFYPNLVALVILKP